MGYLGDGVWYACSARMEYVCKRDNVRVFLSVGDKDVVKGIMELAAEHGISINDESRGYEPALISDRKSTRLNSSHRT